MGLQLCPGGRSGDAATALGLLAFSLLMGACRIGMGARESIATSDSESGAGPRRALSVLFVDDDAADVELQILALRHDFDVHSTRVASAAAYSQALESSEVDIVLCDYEMPGFSGMAALQEWRSRGRRVPFIVVTGRLSEELAVECLKAGATDYVLKGNLVRLPMAIDRALREYEGLRAMRRLAAERARVATAVGQVDEAVVITERDGRIVYVNPSFCRVSGWQADEVLGQTPAILRSGLQGDAFYGDLWRTISSGEVWRGQLVNRRRDGTLYDAELTIAPVFDDAGAITNYCAIQRDVTARVAAERHLRDLNVKLAETDRLKDEFLAAFSHELRTPLNIIIGYSGLMLETVGDQLDAESHHFVERIQDSAVHLTELINATLDLARLRIGAMQVVDSRVDVTALARDVVDELVPMAQRQSLQLTVDSGPVPVEIDTDPVRLRQIVTNLIHNALKFTDEGSVKVSVSGNERQIEVEVRDTGIGIDPALIPYIFEDFRQIDGSPSRQHGGCGLGLALVRRLLDLLGGDITVDSVPGRGSSFAITLPRRSIRPA